ncbi:RrF2 family transcriptional regulator [Paracoccus xiamenensis]|uniref:RrF2 family transcriptional regulator n=1 Tax=Paracoccus xiamenensis TaxID=2714901 RepID=UPI00140CE36E|nr:Rrf2 family transcriptional regulator [Paracoccus xiamenensis]NHF72639.1 Rrf2 family transcriptional regulator [Paracoccus xiamenensis]
MITQKMKYALKALIVLAEEYGEQAKPLQIEEIAKRSGAPKRFLEHILLDLRKEGVLGSVRGRAGGYRMTRDPSTVGLESLLRRIDGPLAPLPCLSRTAYQKCDDCTNEAECRLRRVFAEIFWSYLLLLESLTLADLVGSAGAPMRSMLSEQASDG